jgi:hypothetical protein
MLCKGVWEALLLYAIFADGWRANTKRLDLRGWHAEASAERYFPLYGVQFSALSAENFTRKIASTLLPQAENATFGRRITDMSKP